jgi:hypothetical protein
VSFLPRTEQKMTHRGLKMLPSECPSKEAKYYNLQSAICNF